MKSLNKHSHNGWSLAVCISLLSAGGGVAWAADATTTTTTTTTTEVTTKVVEVDGKKYTCPLTAIDATTGKVDVTKCVALPTTSTTTGTDITTVINNATKTRVVETTEGKFLCKSDAFNSDGSVDTSKCKAIGKTVTGDDSKSTVVCLPVPTTSAVTLTDTSTGTTVSTGSTSTSSSTSSSTSTTSSTSTSTTPKCVKPTKIQDDYPLGKIAGKCPGGGSREVTGGYDSKTGTLDLTITIKDCVDRNGAKHNGTATMQGTILAKTGSEGVFTIKETKTILTTVDSPKGTQYTRACTITRDGDYDTRKSSFKGKSSRDDCTLEGEYVFRDAFVDNLVENSTISEDF